MKLIIPLILILFLSGCDREIQKDYAIYNPVPQIKDTEHLVLNPNASVHICFVSGMIDQSEPLLEGQYKPHAQEIWVDTNFGNNTHANIAVTLHEWAHHVEFEARDGGMGLRERYDLACVLLKALQDVDDQSSGFDTVSWEDWLHFFAPTRKELFWYNWYGYQMRTFNTKPPFMTKDQLDDWIMMNVPSMIHPFDYPYHEPLEGQE